jgi:hypothetical protein
MYAQPLRAVWRYRDQMSSTASETDLGLSRAESWVVHAALLSVVEALVDDGEPPGRALALLRQIERGDDRFDDDQLRLLREIVTDHLREAPPRDVGPARAVVASIEDAQDSSSQ